MFPLVEIRLSKKKKSYCFSVYIYPKTNYGHIILGLKYVQSNYNNYYRMIHHKFGILMKESKETSMMITFFMNIKGIIEGNESE